MSTEKLGGNLAIATARRRSKQSQRFESPGLSPADPKTVRRAGLGRADPDLGVRAYISISSSDESPTPCGQAVPVSAASNEPSAASGPRTAPPAAANGSYSRAR